MIIFPEEASFSAADSFAVDSPGSCLVNCLGGACPTQTQNSPSSCTGTNNLPGGPLNINPASIPGYGALNFDWNFWDSDWTNAWNGAGEDGPGAKDGAVLYDDVSQVVNDKHMSVSVTTNSVSASFERDFTLGRCLSNGNNFYNLSGQLQSTTIENDACKGGDLLVGTLDDCCPGNIMECLDEDSSGVYKCEVPSFIASTCADYPGQTLCEANSGHANTGIPMASYQQPLEACTILQCYWIPPTGNIPGACGVRAIQYQNNPGQACGSGGPTPVIMNNCGWTTTQTACLNGQKTITYIGDSANAQSCNAQIQSPITVPCGSLNFELGFFDTLQFIAAALVIALLYIALGINRRINTA